MNTQNTPQYKNAYKTLSKQNPFKTTLITDSPAAAKAITASINAAIPSNSVTTLKSFAKYIVEKTHPEISIINTDEQFIAFSKIAAGGELSVSKNKSRASPALVNQLIYIYNTEKTYLTKVPPASKKHEAVIKIIREYEDRLEKNKLCDSFSVMEKAVSILENKEFNPGNIILFKIRPQNKLAQKLLDAITNAADEVITYSPEIPKEVPKTLAKENITAYKDSNTEIKATLEKISRLIESGVSPKEILLLSPSLSKTVSLLNEFAPDFFVNTPSGAKTLKYHCFDRGTPLASIPVVRSALAYLSAVTRNFKLEDLEEIADSPYFPKNPAKISAGSLRKIGVTAQISDKKENWQNAGQKLSKKKREAMASELKNLNILINLLAEPKPVNTIRGHCAAFKAMLEKLGWTDVPLTGEAMRARTAFLRLADSLETSSVRDEEVDSTAFYSYILRFALTKFTAKEETDDSFCVSKLGSASSLCADYVFVVGLSADNIPNIPSTIPPFCESETEEILPTLKQDVFEAEKYRFLTALSSAKKELQLSCAKKESGSTGKNLTPSSFLTKLFDCEPETRYIELKHSILENQIKAGSMIYKIESFDRFDELEFEPDCLEPEDFALESSETPACENKSCKGLVGLTCADAVIKQIKRESKRGSADFSNSDEEKDAEAALKSFERYNEEHQFAPTTLENYITCPFAWYLKHHLNLSDLREENSQATTVGNTVHKILQRFVEEYLKPITEYNKAEAKDELMKIAREEFDKVKLKTPSFLAVREYYLGENGLKSVFDDFIENEIELASIGLATTRGLTEKEIESFVELNGERILLKGKIDRILVNDDKFAVADYKTGSGFAFSSKDNSKLQIPLYSKMFENFSGMTSIGGFYLKVAPKEFKTIGAFGASPEETTELVIRASFDAVNSMRRGVCRIAGSECGEEYCAYKYICGRSKSGGE